MSLVDCVYKRYNNWDQNQPAIIHPIGQSSVVVGTNAVRYFYCDSRCGWCYANSCIPIFSFDYGIDSGRNLSKIFDLIDRKVAHHNTYIFLTWQVKDCGRILQRSSMLIKKARPTLSCNLQSMTLRSKQDELATQELFMVQKNIIGVCIYIGRFWEKRLENIGKIIGCESFILIG